MAQLSEIWICPHCGFRMNIAALGLYAEVQCQSCLHKERVHAQLGNFRLDAIIGVGGMSIVYRAFDVVLQRPLALKVLNDAFRNMPERIERFENESAMMARVHHENVTSIYSAGRAYGQFYIAMELVEGKNLEYMVSRDAPMPQLQALDITRQVAYGLRAANEAGLLHRDMKPGNILITNEGQAKVIDFGLAMDRQEGDTEEIIWATPYYVPPETLQRKPEDARSDIYALGMTLRFLLTGEESFGPQQNASLQALVRCKSRLTPLARQHKRLNRKLCALVDHMTRFAPADRPAGYDELIAEIDEVRRSLAIKPLSAAERKRRLLVRGGVLGGAAVMGFALGLALSPSAPPKKQLYLPVQNPEMPPPQAEEETIRAALALIDGRRYDEAVKMLLQAAESEQEPALGAWYAQLARFILLSGRLAPSDAERAQMILTQQLNAPTRNSNMRLLRKMSHSPYPNASDWISGQSAWNDLSEESVRREFSDLEHAEAPPVVRAMLWYELEEKARWLGMQDTADACSRMRHETLASLGGYSPMANLLSTPSIHRKLSVKKRNDFNLGKEAMLKRNFDEAMDRFAIVSASEQYDSQIKTRAQIFYEVCELTKGAFELLKRKFPDRFRHDMSAEELIHLAKGITPASRNAIRATGSLPDHPVSNLIDGKLDTCWRPDVTAYTRISQPGRSASFGPKATLEVDVADPIRYIDLHFEPNSDVFAILAAYSQGEALHFPLQHMKNEGNVGRVELGDKVIDRIELTTTGYGVDSLPGIAEIQLITPEGRRIAPDARTGRNDLADALRLFLTMPHDKLPETLSQMDFVVDRLSLQDPLSIVVRNWAQRQDANKAEPLDGSIRTRLANSTAYDYKDIIHICQECVAVRVLPGKAVSFYNRSAELGEGDTMICPRQTAEALHKKGLVEILPDAVAVALGLQKAQHNACTIIPGEIQPCLQADAEYFSRTGAAKLLRSVDDLADVLDKVKPDAYPLMLRRVPKL